MVCKALGGISIFLAILAIVSASIIKLWLADFIKAEIKKFVSITGTDAPGYQVFRNETQHIDLHEDYYIFNVTNPEEVLEGKSVNVTQIGPFKFKLNKYRPEANISWETDGTVQFMAQTEFEFVGDEAEEKNFNTTKVTTWRLGLLGSMKQLTYGSQTSNLVEDFVDLTLERLVFLECTKKLNIISPFIEVTIRELLMGYNDPLLGCAQQPSERVAIINQPVHSASSTALSAIYSGGDYSMKTNPPPPANKENEYSMYLGMKEPLPFWGSPYANMLNGTKGDSLQPGEAKVHHEAYIWVDTFLRSAKFKGMAEIKYKGVQTVAYQLDLASFTNGQTNPDNKAFFITTTGMQPSPPNVHTPVVFSNPYYQDADVSNIKVNFVGSAQDVSATWDLATTLQFEPHTGILFKVHKRIQGSVQIGSHDEFPDVVLTTAQLFPFSANWTHTYAPIFWADEHMELGDDQVDKFKGFLDLPLSLVQVGFWVLLFAALIFVGFSVAFCWCASRQSTKSEATREESGATYGAVGDTTQT